MGERIQYSLVLGVRGICSEASRLLKGSLQSLWVKHLCGSQGTGPRNCSAEKKTSPSKSHIFLEGLFP